MITLVSGLSKSEEEMADLLCKDGLIVDRIYPFGVIKGRADDDVIKKLRNNPAILDIQAEVMIDIGPPDKDVQ